MGNSLLEQEPLKNWAVTVELCRNQFNFCQSERIIQVMFIGQNRKSLYDHYIMIIQFHYQMRQVGLL